MRRLDEAIPKDSNSRLLWGQGVFAPLTQYTASEMPSLVSNWGRPGPLSGTERDPEGKASGAVRPLFPGVSVAVVVTPSHRTDSAGTFSRMSFSWKPNDLSILGGTRWRSRRFSLTLVNDRAAQTVAPEKPVTARPKVVSVGAKTSTAPVDSSVKRTGGLHDSVASPQGLVSERSCRCRQNHGRHASAGHPDGPGTTYVCTSIPANLPRLCTDGGACGPGRRV